MNDNDMEAAPVAMDTGGTPWDTAASSSSDSSWANFDSKPEPTTTTETSPSSKPQEAWADFSNFSAIDGNTENICR